ncbi:unnamed protein product [Clavelina lepadiformis]|uniref:Ephrin RBD domain-containing protein n=1 Tax=Clavelina lepadiformis TaxID=159417 RepID=A0ABP0GWL3_CLALP
MYRVMLLACAVTVVVSSCAERHVIYWNSQMTPQLLSTVKCTFPVRIGEFMDILCPQKSLMGILYDAREPEIFDLYNVTEEDFNNCNHKGKKDFIFACERPEQENKLTIKFQLVSPSPFGFKFQYCKDYYFVASPRVKDLKPGCHENVSTRLHISVACERMYFSRTINCCLFHSAVVFDSFIIKFIPNCFLLTNHLTVFLRFGSFCNDLVLIYRLVLVNLP